MSELPTQGERVLIRRLGDRTFIDGCLELIVTPDKRFAVVANRGFEVVRQDGEFRAETIVGELLPPGGDEPEVKPLPDFSKEP